MEDRDLLDAMYACLDAKKNFESVRSGWNETELKVAEDKFLFEIDERIQRATQSNTGK